MNSIFQGLSAFPLTPASSSGRVDVAALGALLERLVDAGVDSIGLLGSTGIYAYLEPSERRRAVSAAVEAVAGRTPLIVGVSALRTDWTLDLARDAEKQGASALLVAPMSYTPPTEDEVFAHYAAVAGATALPICVYNNPGTTHVTLSRPFLAKLSGLASVEAVKMPAPKDGGFREELEALRAVTQPGFSIGYSVDPATVPALLAGADAFFSGIAGVLPRPMFDLARAARNGRADAAARLNTAFEPLWGFCRAHGALRVAYAINRLLDLGAGEPPLPLLPLSADEHDEIAKALDELEKAG